VNEGTLILSVAERQLWVCRIQ